MSLALVSRVTADLRAALAGVVVGQEEAADELLAAYLAGGHVLLLGVPGVAKTLLARALAAALGLPFGRVQFTPDLMPADVVGGSLFDFQQRRFTLQKGPIFCAVLLADEINRAPPKTQAALLEAMQERQVTIDGESHPLDEQFFVVATQNPIDHEGTYPLPEAQLDRFLLQVRVGYPSPAAELAIYQRHLQGTLAAGSGPLSLKPVLQGADLVALRAAVRGVHVEEGLLRYLLQVVAETRKSPQLTCGASPRAGLALLGVAQAWAAMEGRDFLLPDDIKRMAIPALAHRLAVTAETELEGTDAAAVLRGILARLELPK